ncbi:hypothetical protein B0H11DRAFT_1965581 [Mycena galericulata]|nr:hypothetical protein B0H11DRAFT_1965581 [Mycena galericulata]
MSILHHATLPTELWLEIFTHLDTRSYSISHEPFQPVPGVASEGNVNSSYTTVVLVCRNWRAWALGMLYRNIKLSDCSPVLHQAIDVHGQWVRRAVVPYSTTVTESCKPMPSTQILRLCPNLEVLVRPPYAPNPRRQLRFEFDATCPPLASLKRLDFWNHFDASRSGGINSLTAVLSVAPNLEYLFIGGGIANSAFYGLAKQVYLPRLRTLRLRIANALLLRDLVQRWTMPALDNLVMDSPVADMSMDMVWEELGPRLRTVELGRHMRFLLDQTLMPCLQGCLALQELNYHILITMPPEASPEAVFPSVTSIGIHFSENPYLEDRRAEWEHVERHFDAFAGGMFPSLRRVYVYWARESILADARFAAIHQRLRDRRCVLEFGDGTPVSVSA